MKKCFYVSSCIEVDETAPLTYAPKRSVFSTGERYRQTLVTVNTLKCLEPNATVYVLDSSVNWQGYKSLFELLFRDCHYVPMKELCHPNDYVTIRSHPNKSLGESITLRDFLYAYEEPLRQYDYLFKMSGRYVLNDGYDSSLFDETRRNQIFFKTPLVYEWQDKWSGMKTDVRQEEGHNHFKQYCSVFYGYGREHLETFKSLYAGMVGILRHPSMLGYDVETLLYYLLKEYQPVTTTLPVRVMGWEGPSGDLMRY